MPHEQSRRDEGRTNARANDVVAGLRLCAAFLLGSFRWAWRSSSGLSPSPFGAPRQEPMPVGLPQIGSAPTTCAQLHGTVHTAIDHQFRAWRRHDFEPRPLNCREVNAADPDRSCPSDVLEIVKKSPKTRVTKWAV